MTIGQHVATIGAYITQLRYERLINYLKIRQQVLGRGGPLWRELQGLTRDKLQRYLKSLPLRGSKAFGRTSGVLTIFYESYCLGVCLGHSSYSD
jgi:hypothetical protein